MDTSLTFLGHPTGLVELDLTNCTQVTGERL